MRIEYYYSIARKLINKGLAWRGKQFLRLIKSFCYSFARVDDKAKEVLNEAYPTEAKDLTNWQIACGLPDECTGDFSSNDARRAAVLARLNQSGSANPDDIIASCHEAGFDVEITEYYPMTCNDTCNDQLWGMLASRYWEAKLLNADDAIVYASCNDTCNDPLREYTATLFVCIIERLRPLHTTVFYEFEGA